MNIIMDFEVRHGLAAARSDQKRRSVL